jgi:hypothetical protein
MRGWSDATMHQFEHITGLGKIKHETQNTPSHWGPRKRSTSRNKSQWSVPYFRIWVFEGSSMQFAENEGVALPTWVLFNGRPKWSMSYHVAKPKLETLWFFCIGFTIPPNVTCLPFLSSVCMMIYIYMCVCVYYYDHYCCYFTIIIMVVIIIIIIFQCIYIYILLYHIYI